jgi:conjugal transfer/entry exclusion protein
MDSVQVHCNRCKTVFRELARRLQNGYSRQCPCCEVVLFFDEDSHSPDIKTAMRKARAVRKQLREAEQALITDPKRSVRSSRVSGGRESEDSRTE